MLLAILQMKKSSSDLASDLWLCLNLWGFKVHCPAVTVGWVQGCLPCPKAHLLAGISQSHSGWDGAVARGQSPTHTHSGPIVLAG